jgi:asparagine synthase (glutamine-hydrolysing)
VTVALSGDGGDEMFAGYNRHAFAARYWPTLSRVPAPLRQLGASLVRALPPKLAANLFAVRQAGEKLEKLAAILGERNLPAIQALLAAQGLGQDESLLAHEAPSPYLAADYAGFDPVDGMQLTDFKTYLPGDVLAKVDRASMSCGLEVRVPLLDHRLIGLAFALPANQRFAHGQGKALLRKALACRLPASLIQGKPKMGFALPIDEWLKGPLAEWAGDLIGGVCKNADGLFDAKRIERMWHEHRTGRRKRHHALWNLLMFLAWRNAWGRP